MFAGKLNAQLTFSVCVCVFAWANSPLRGNLLVPPQRHSHTTTSILCYATFLENERHLRKQTFHGVCFRSEKVFAFYFFELNVMDIFMIIRGQKHWTWLKRHECCLLNRSREASAFECYVYYTKVRDSRHRWKFVASTQQLPLRIQGACTENFSSPSKRFIYK